MTTSTNLGTRALTGLVVLAGLSLAGCSGDSGDDVDDDPSRAAGSAEVGAPEQACRTYRLSVAGEDDPAVQAVADATRTGSYLPEDLTALLDPVIVAAAKAGATTDLPAEDFDRYLALVEAGQDARTAVIATDSSFTREIVLALRGSVTAVRTACESS